MAVTVCIGVTGHQGLKEPTSALVSHALAVVLRQRGHVVGLSSLAEGADQLFAQSVLDHGGQLHAVIPSRRYELAFPHSGVRAYEKFLAACEAQTELDFPEPSESAFYAAGRWIVDHSDELIAVWDGKPAKGLGGTADIVDYARTRGVDVTVIWPDGSARS